MRKAFHIILFIAILGFLLYLVPPINQALKSQLFIATPTTTTLGGVSQSTNTAPLTKGPCPQTSLLTCIGFPNGTYSVENNFKLAENHAPYCECPNNQLHAHAATLTPRTTGGVPVGYADNSGCGYGCVTGTVGSATTTSSSPPPSTFNYNPLGNLSSPTLYSAPTCEPTSNPCLECKGITSSTLPVFTPTTGFFIGQTYYQAPNGQKFFSGSFDTSSGCMKVAPGIGTNLNTIFDDAGACIAYEPDASGCYGTLTATATSPTNYTLPILYPPTDFQPTISYAPPVETIPPPVVSSGGTTTTGTTGGIMIGTTSTTDTTSTTMIDGGPSTFIEEGTTGSGTTASGTTGSGTTGSGTTGSTTTSTGGAMPVECIDTGNKDFDYGAVASANPQSNIPWGTVEAPHFVSHSQFYSVRIGPSVDAPEYMASDVQTSDQDGLDFSMSNNMRIVLNDIYNVRNDYGTIVVGSWEKGTASYSFKVLAAIQVSASSLIFQPDGVYVNFETSGADMHDGWLTVLYFDAEGSVDPNVPGSNQFGINGMPNFGFTLAQVKQWDGTNPDLDRIIYGGVRAPFDVSRAPGEVEDYLYCDRGATGFRYYRPGDPQYSADCGAPPPAPIADICVNTPTTGTPTVNVVCNFNNVQNFVCPTGGGTGSTGTTGTISTTTAPIDNRPVATIIQDLLTQYRGNSQNNAETRLRIIHQYLRAVLPQL